jgi:hypothetical protein
VDAGFSAVVAKPVEHPRLRRLIATAVGSRLSGLAENLGRASRAEQPFGNAAATRFLS